MPTYSADYLGRLAGFTGFRPDTLEKVLRLGRVLDQVGRHPFLRDRLALKGGTALNLFFGAQAPRLSVDLDFNYVRPVERDEMLREKEEIERALGLVAEGDGYRLQWSAPEHAGRKFYLGYWNAHGTPDRIELDVNFLYRVSLQPVVVQDGWTPDTDFPCRARLVGLGLFLGAIVAWVTSGRSAADLRTNMPCRRSPGRRRCSGEILALFEADGSTIAWHCPVCGDNGVIRGWEGTRWDRGLQEGP